MNKNLQQLFNISKKKERLVVGLMSGTSLDGLDIALCKFSGSGMQTQFALQNFITIPYKESFKNEVLQVFAKKHSVSLEKVCLLNAFIGKFHGELVLQALKGWGVDSETVDLVASHGQTIYHAPRHQHQQPRFGNATLQIGDGDHLAVTTGIVTISDFRQKHITAGGEGAPLALYGDVILGSKPGENRILLNIGGIANLTYLPGDGNLSKVLCTDIGPGNTLIDAACRQYFNVPYDEDARIARSGTVNEHLMDALLHHPFFNEALPKTTGPELFNLNYVADAQQATRTLNISKADLIATLSAFTAQSIARFIGIRYSCEQLQVFASGGGARNPYVIDKLSRLLPNCTIGNTNDLGINPDAKEALLFALLANEAVSGEPLHIGSNPAVLMGKVSFLCKESGTAGRLHATATGIKPITMKAGLSVYCSTKYTFMSAYKFLLMAHSGFRYIVMVMLVIAILGALAGWFGKRPYTEGNRKLNLFAMISAHIQLLLGLALYFVSPFVKFGADTMKDDTTRYWTVEHIAMMIFAIALITIGHARSKRAATAEGKHRAIAIFYLLATIVVVVAVIQSQRGLLGMTH